MARVYRQAVSIDEIENQHRDDVQQIPHQDAAPTTFPTFPRAVEAATIRASHLADLKTRRNQDLKYLIIAGVLALVFVLVYRRLRPYIELFQKLTKLTTGVLDQTHSSAQKTVAKNKLTRCSSCGTWIPQVRAVAIGSSFYCSQDCVEKVAARNQTKAAS